MSLWQILQTQSLSLVLGTHLIELFLKLQHKVLLHNLKKLAKHFNFTFTEKKAAFRTYKQHPIYSAM